MNFENPKKSFLGTCLTMIYLKFWTFLLKTKFRRDCPVFYYLDVFSAFSWLGAISSEGLKVNWKEFRKSEKNTSQGIAQGCFLKFLAIYPKKKRCFHFFLSLQGWYVPNIRSFAWKLWPGASGHTYIQRIEKGETRPKPKNIAGLGIS